jgi:cytochrome d ubiquinol oxidase subunit I
MKIAAAEAQWDTCQPCSFSAFQIGGGNDDPTPTKIIQIPHLLSVLATGTWNGEVQGMNELQAQYEQEYGSGYYIPNVFIQYWSMRVMAYLGALMSLLALWGAWLLGRRKLETSRVFLWVATWAVIAPFLMNTAGWMLTENGRQPWLVQGLMQTEDGVSPSVSTTDMVISLAAYYAIFIALAGVYAFLMFRYARRGLELEHEELPPDDTRTPALTY